MPIQYAVATNISGVIIYIKLSFFYDNLTSKIFPHTDKRVNMQDGHCHEDHVGDLGYEMGGDTSSAFAPGKY